MSISLKGFIKSVSLNEYVAASQNPALMAEIKARNFEEYNHAYVEHQRAIKSEKGNFFIRFWSRLIMFVFALVTIGLIAATAVVIWAFH